VEQSSPCRMVPQLAPPSSSRSQDPADPNKIPGYFRVRANQMLKRVDTGTTHISPFQPAAIRIESSNVRQVAGRGPESG
jgi:hypothetical protein